MKNWRDYVSRSHCDCYTNDANIPDATQNQAAQDIANYITDLQDDLRWDESFKKTEPNLIQQARLAKQQIAEGKASRMDISHL